MLSSVACLAPALLLVALLVSLLDECLSAVLAFKLLVVHVDLDVIVKPANFEELLGAVLANQYLLHSLRGSTHLEHFGIVATQLLRSRASEPVASTD